MNDPIVDLSHEMIRKGSKSFAAAAWLFDPQTRGRAYMLYAWCRYCDDCIDGQELGFTAREIQPEESMARLAELRASTRDAFAGKPLQDPVFRAFQRVAGESAIPPSCAMDLLEGFAMDVRRQPYPELQDTLLYCYRVAGVVGVMMACVMGARERDVLARAADLGIAFQLTNIARDVMDDAAVGRCYLPGSWLAEAGIPAGAWREPAHRPELARVVARLLDEADRYYASSTRGLQALPFRSAWAVATALGVYREIGEIVRRQGASAWQQRAVVSRTRKAWHGIAGFARALRAHSLDRWSSASPRDASLWMMPGLSMED